MVSRPGLIVEHWGRCSFQSTSCFTGLPGGWYPNTLPIDFPTSQLTDQGRKVVSDQFSKVKFFCSACFWIAPVKASLILGAAASCLRFASLTNSALDRLSSEISCLIKFRAARVVAGNFLFLTRVKPPTGNMSTGFWLHHP